MTRLRALVLCPTRELTRQVAEEAAAIMQGSVLRVVAAHGKVAISPQASEIARGVDLLVATPGRVRELLEHGSLSLAYIKHVAIDEADRMLDMGFLPQITQILQAMPSQRQIVLFTSTMPYEVEELAQQFLHHAVRIEVDPHTTPVEHVEQHLLPIDDDEKVELLLHMLGSGDRRGVLVFCRTRRRVGWVGAALKRHDISVGTLHGDMSQAQRKKSLDGFTNRELRVLVATDVAGRGLHIPAVKTVVNYDLPPTPEEFVHRIGRAGHGGGFGEAFTFLSDDKVERLRWRAVLNKLGVEIYAETIQGFESSKKPRYGGSPSKRKHARRDTDREESEAHAISRRELKRLDTRPRRSKKGRPIRRGEKPGKGVKRSP